MDNTEIKLTHCFKLAFHNLDPSLIPAASAATMAEWDSIRQVTLLTLICEEFGIDMDFEEFEDATSFEALAAGIRRV